MGFRTERAEHRRRVNSNSRIGSVRGRGWPHLIGAEGTLPPRRPSPKKINTLHLSLRSCEPRGHRGVEVSASGEQAHPSISCGRRTRRLMPRRRRRRHPVLKSCRIAHRSEGITARNGVNKLADPGGLLWKRYCNIATRRIRYEGSHHCTKRLRC